MNCQFPGMEEEYLSHPGIRPQDIKIEIKSEEEDHNGSIDIKCETYSTVDVLASVDTELEVDESEETAVGRYSPAQCSEISNKDLTCNSMKSSSSNKSFSQKNNNITQLLLHSNDKSFKCSVCHKSFTHKSNLNQHIRLHTNEKPFKCLVCSKSFTRSTILHEHFRLHTNEKPFKCSFCSKSFTQRSHLNTHLRLHTKEKPFKCPCCSKSFNQTSSLNRHLQLHSNEKLLN